MNSNKPAYFIALNVIVLFLITNLNFAAATATNTKFPATKVQATTPLELAELVHQQINNHQRIPYTSGQTDTWDVLEQAQAARLDTNNIITLYKNAAYSRQGGGNDFYNREHTWPKSYGFPDNNSDNYAYTDLHALFLADSSYNSSRSNKPFDYCSGDCEEKITLLNNAIGGNSASSNWTQGAYTQGSWEVWSERQGDVARAVFYMAVRYQGGLDVKGENLEPDLRLTNERNLIENSNTGENNGIAYMGILATLLEWHKNDPVDENDRQRNDVIEQFQNNRNPFIDNPEYVDCIFAKDCSAIGGQVGDFVSPLTPVNLLLSEVENGEVNLSWQNNTENDLAGFYVYRDNNDGNFWRVNAEVLTDANYKIKVASNDFSIAVAAVDLSLNESAMSEALIISNSDSESEQGEQPTEQPTPEKSGGGSFFIWFLFLLLIIKIKNNISK